ncbi:hypothetical protein SDC9_165233 [bioreactor metagenome]|uniref:Uncharacterized protein n=1 Tax=bioreactor metagenome TaxID=1076179 RepID=A0A645FTU4_9ZZZZ
MGQQQATATPEVSETPSASPSATPVKNEVAILSGGKSVTPYKYIMWSTQYDAVTGQAIEADMLPLDMSQAEAQFPQIDVVPGLQLSLKGNCALRSLYTVYDAQFNEVKTFSELSAVEFSDVAGEYCYISFDIVFTEDYIEAANANNSSGATFYAKLMLSSSETPTA